MDLESYIEMVITTNQKDIDMIDIDLNPNMDLKDIEKIINSNISKNRKAQSMDAIISSLIDFNLFYKPFCLTLDDFIIEWLIQNNINLISLAHLYIKPKYLEQIINILGNCLEAKEKLKEYAEANKKLLDYKKKMEE